MDQDEKEDASEYDIRLKLWTRVYQLLPHEHAVVVDLYFAHRMTQAAIALKMELSQKRISDILQSAYKKLSKDSELKALWSKVGNGE